MVFHRLDDEDGLAFGDLGADRNEGRLARLGREIGRAHHREVRVPGLEARSSAGAAAAAAAAALTAGGAGAAAGRRSIGRNLHVLDGVMAIREGDADAHVLALDLDLGQVLLVEQLGDGLDQVPDRTVQTPWSMLSLL